MASLGLPTPHSHPRKFLRARSTAADIFKNMAAMVDAKNSTYNRANAGYSTGNAMYTSQYNTRGQMAHAYGMHHNPNPDLAALAHGFQGMNLPNTSFAAQAKTAAMMPAAMAFRTGTCRTSRSTPSCATWRR